ncbi:MAG: hypothetical protein KVP17_000348 [Porospora cf. gigantea B]|uniref:uncharacterized protein n=1 Tax=Porospora cf. gigantea B TaxID=2853592 RepID=UPI003571FA3F|nr:MAG: hypothetical protein KVP17_000348 [Porospora cf. gigantea B]
MGLVFVLMIMTTLGSKPDPTQFRNQPISEETLVQKIEKHQNNDFGARKIVRAIPTVRENDLGADYLDASGREALLAYEMKAAAAMQNEEAQMNKSKKAMEEFLRAENAKGLQFSLDQLRGGIAKGGRVPVRTADGRLTLQPLSKRYRNPSWSEKLKSIVNGELSFTDAAIRKRAREQLERDIRDVHDALLQQSLLSLEENHSDQASIQDWAAGDTGGREDARVAARVAANKILHSLLKPSKTK